MGCYKKILVQGAIGLCVMLFLSSCSSIFSIFNDSDTTDQPHAVSSGEEPPCGGTKLNILSGSENQIFASDIQNWGCKNGYQLVFWWKGSVDIARILSDPSQYIHYDASMAANSLWHRLGDTDNILRYEESIYTSPIVFLAEHQTSITDELGWTSSNTLELEQIITAAENGKITFGITSATQSNSGNNMFMAILDYARKKAGYLDAPMLTADMLMDSDVVGYMKRVLAQVQRSSASTGFLGQVFERQYPNLTGVFVYETVAMEAIRNLRQQSVKKDDLPRIYYVMDAVAEANAPLALINHSAISDKQEKAFLKLQEWLLSDEGQRMLFNYGARVRNISTYSKEDIDRVFSPQETGVDLNLVLMAAPIPREPEIIRTAMNFYQSEWRRPSCTAIVTDHSGSMNSSVDVQTETQHKVTTTGADQLINALNLLLNQDLAAEYYLQATQKDYLVVVPFTSSVNIQDIIEIHGNEKSVYEEKLKEINKVSFGGGTDMYVGLETALKYMENNCSPDQLPAVILMTDGMSQGNIQTLKNAWNTYYKRVGYAVPIFNITFGNADVSQLQDIAELTLGDVFNGTHDLWAAFAKAKGNN